MEATLFSMTNPDDASTIDHALFRYSNYNYNSIQMTNGVTQNTEYNIPNLDDLNFPDGHQVLQP